MLKKTKLQLISLACVLGLALFQPVFAQSSSGTTTIKQIDTGWSSDTFGVMTAAPVLNPAGCTASDMYESSQPAAGYNTFYAAALTAFSTGSQVVIIVSSTTCTQNRPTIMGIYLVNS